MNWFKENLIPGIAIVISLLTLTFTSISDSTAKTINITDRLEALEKNVNEIVPRLSSEVAELEKNSAVTNQILYDLKTAVNDLNTSTKELTRISTVVAVMDEKVSNLEKDSKNKGR